MEKKKKDAVKKAVPVQKAVPVAKVKPSAVVSAAPVKAVRNAVSAAAVAAPSRPASGKLLNEERLFAMIQAKAYELFVARGCVPGHDLTDWYEAEKLVKKEIRG